MKRILCIAVALAFVFGFTRQVSAEDLSLRIGGSTTLLPIVAKCASDFMEKYGTWDKVDPSLPAEEVVVFVSGGGSGFGVRSAINGTVHIGLASRHVKDKEKKLLGAHKTYLVGKDAVVIAANKKNPVSPVRDGFTSAELAAIFSGKLGRYSDIDASLADREVVLFVRDSGAGSAEMFQDLVLKDEVISANALQLPSQGALLKKLETSEVGIGYISSGLAFSSQLLKAFDLDGVTPTNANFINGTYAFTRPLLLVVKGAPDARSQRFIDYVLNEGQEIVEKNNYVSVRAAGE